MNNSKKKKTIAKRQVKQKEALLEHLKRMPILQIAFEKASITRATYYRWRNEDAEFRKLTDEATVEGEELINDVSESQLISSIRDRNLSAVSLWLRHHHPKYAPRLEITTRPKSSEQLTPEQEAMVKKALRLASMGGGKIYGTKNKKSKRGKRA